MIPRSMRAAALFAALTLPMTFAGAAAAPPAAPAPTGFLVMAHGGAPEWNAAVEAAVAPLRAEGPVAIAFGMADPATLQTAVSTLEAAGAGSIAVVRLFVSGDSFRHQTEYLLGLRPDPPARFLLHAHGGHGAGAAHGAAHGHGAHDAHRTPPAAHAAHPSDTAAAPPTPRPIRRTLPIALSEGGLDRYAAVGAILTERVRALSRAPEREAVLVLSHGFEDESENERARGRMQALANEAGQLGRFAEIRVETLREDWPEARRAAEARIRAFVEEHARAGRRTLVVPFRVFGFGPYRDVLAGLDYDSDGRGLLPHPAITGWIRAQGRAVAERQGWLAANVPAPAPAAGHAEETGGH